MDASINSMSRNITNPGQVSTSQQESSRLANALVGVVQSMTVPPVYIINLIDRIALDAGNKVLDILLQSLYSICNILPGPIKQLLQGLGQVISGAGTVNTGAGANMSNTGENDTQIPGIANPFQ